MRSTESAHITDQISQVLNPALHNGFSHRFAHIAPRKENRAMNFYYDPKSQASIDRNSGIFVRPTGQYSEDGWEQHIFVDPHSRVRRPAGIGIFEFSAKALVRILYQTGENGRRTRIHIYDGYEMAMSSIAPAFDDYIRDQGRDIGAVKDLLTCAFLAQLRHQNPERQFDIRFT